MSGNGELGTGATTNGSGAQIDENLGLGVVVEATHPLYLAPGDTSGISLISVQLTGTDNYSLWNRSMRIALLGRNKLGLVDGSWKKERFHEKFGHQWERCNAIVLSWLMNSVSQNLISEIAYATDAHVVWTDLKERFDKIDGSRSFNLHREIATLVQGTSTISANFTKLKELWDESETLIPLPGCNCEKSKDFLVHLKRQKLYQFLMGLNDSYIQARSQILLMISLPSVNQAYSMLMSDESQKAMSSAASNSVLGAPPLSNGGNFENTALYSSRTGNGNGSYNTNRFKKSTNLYCEVCKLRNHTKENCYKVIGYPSDRFKKKGGVSAGNAYKAMVDTYSGGSQSMSQQTQAAQQQTQATQASTSQTTGQGNQMAQPCIFTKDQYNQILQMLNVAQTTALANSAGSLQWEGESDW